MMAPTTEGVVLEDDTTPARPDVLLLDPRALALAYQGHPQWPMVSWVLLVEGELSFPSQFLSCACV